MVVRLALLAAVALGAPPGRPALSKDGTVQTPEGIRFRLPRGFTYLVQEKDGTPFFLAHDSAREAGVTAMVVSGESLDCSGDDARQMGFELFRTAEGLEGCIKVVEAGEAAAGVAAPGGALAVLLIGVGKVVVSVNAVARDRALAVRLARGVADSLTIPRSLGEAAPRASARGGASRVAPVEPRLVGCFEYSGSTSSLAVIAVRTRCYRSDGTFEERVMVSARAGSDETSSSAQDDGRSRGRWSYRKPVLELIYEDGTRSEEEIRLGTIGYTVGERYWRKYSAE